MSYPLQNALVGLLSVLTLYALLSVIGRAITLFFEIKNFMTREKDLENFAKTLVEGINKKDLHG